MTKNTRLLELLQLDVSTPNATILQQVHRGKIWKNADLSTFLIVANFLQQKRDALPLAHLSPTFARSDLTYSKKQLLEGHLAKTL